MHSPEQNRNSEIKTGAIEKAAAERAAELAKSAERSIEHNENDILRTVEKARIEAQSEAISGKETGAGESLINSVSDKPPLITGFDREQRYKQTMSQVQKELSPPARAFSKVIHHPIVERTSEAVGATVARPNAILSGSICAFLLVLGVYALGRHNGFSLQGSETIIFFALGWAIGIAIDMLRAIFRRK